MSAESWSDRLLGGFRIGPVYAAGNYIIADPYGDRTARAW